MAQDLMIPEGFGQVAPIFQGLMAGDDELSSGVVGGFGVLGIRGKAFWLKYRGDEQLVTREDDPNDPVTNVEMVLVKASPHISKVYYEGGYDDSSSSPPSCFSNDGVRPDASVAAPQCASCAICPKNAFGSRITEAGKQAKACTDSKRIAIVPTGDMENDMWGGPMLLRVPAASLSDMATYGKKLRSIGQASFTVSTRLRFDVNEAYPKLVFQAVRPLTSEEGAFIAELRNDPRVARILSDASDLPAQSGASEQITEAQVFEQPQPQPPKQAAVTRPATAPRPAVAPRPAAAPRPTPSAAPPVATGGVVGGQAPTPRPAAPRTQAAAAAAPAPRPPAPRPAAPPQRVPVAAPRTTGFGARPAAAPPPAPAPEPVYEEQPAEDVVYEEPAGEAPTAFTASLDAEIDALLG